MLAAQVRQAEGHQTVLHYTRPVQDARVVPAADLQRGIALCGKVHGLLHLVNAGRRLYHRAQHQRHAVADAAVYAAVVVGSRDDAVRQRAREIMSKAIRLARDLGIRTIQLAGYDVYYEDHDEGTRQRFAEGLAWAVEQAAASQVMLAVEIMDTAFMNSISKWKKWDEMLASPWFTVYPDVGNLSAWGNDVPAELKLGIDRIAAIHLKDTQPVTGQSPGQFRDVPFGEGCVDFVGIFKTLHKLNYRGSFLIEMWTEKAKEPVLEIIQARRWIEARMQEAGFIC